MEYWYVHYPGHLGRNPVTEFPGMSTGVLWDAPVKRVRARFAAQLVAEGGFERALPLDEAAEVLDRGVKDLRALVKDERLRPATYQPQDSGAKPVPLIVIPAGLTAGALKTSLEEESTDG